MTHKTYNVINLFSEKKRIIPMILNSISLRGSLSESFLLHFPLRFKLQNLILKPLQNLRKVFGRNWSRTALSCYALDEFPVQENEWNLKGNEFLQIMMEERGIHANCQTYLCLLEFCLNSGSLLEGKKLHGKILKVGFGEESILCDKLIDFYFAANDLDGVYKVFNDMPSRNLLTWNNMLSGFLAKKMWKVVLDLFSEMVAANMSPNELTFASVLRARGGGGNVAFHYVKQIHGMIISRGFGTRPVVCNPLIDLYGKNGFINLARKVFNQLGAKDSVSWVAMISCFSHNGYEKDAIHLFHEMRDMGILPTPYMFSSILSACTKIESFDIGEQLHALVLKLGFSLETYVCNALVTLYSRMGNFVCADKVFSKMLYKDEVSYNSLISGLAQQGFSDRALDLFKSMQLDHLMPDCVTIASVLSACASAGALCKGKQLHSHVIKSGMASDIIIEGSLLDLYVKCSNVKTAHKLFLTSHKENNVVPWNVMLVAYGQLDNLSESFEIFRQMQIEGLLPNQFTFPSILRTCTSLGALELGQQIHTQVIKSGFQLNVYVCSVLIDMYAKLGELDTARGILNSLTEEDVVSWTAMIAGYTQHDMFTEALTIFEEMLSQGVESDNIGLSSAISACTGVQALSLGRQIHAQSFVSGYSKDLSICNALVSLYARCGKKDEAYLAFKKIDDKDSISWNGLISGFAQSGYCEEALKVFVEMNRAEVEPSLFTFGSAVSGSANIANIKQGKEIHAMIIKRGFNSEVEVSNALIALYAKCGSIDEAKREFLEIPKKNEISWNSMITAYSQHGYGTEAVRLFEQMKHIGETPTHVTFLGVLSACSHIGWVDEGLGYFWSMRNVHGLVPKPEHYACVVDLLSRAGFLTRAINFIREMPIEPDAMVWRTLLSASIIHKNLEVGEFSARRLIALEPEDSATYVLQSNLYAVCRKWNQRDQTRQMMKDRGVKKEPGRSWLEVKNSIHSFFVGDRLHPLSDSIYEYLADLNKRVAEKGYVQDRYSLLNEVEQEQKDSSELIHSEKLAISFALLSLPDAIPIRIMKNLRVCNDCHKWIKFVSKISNREIIVRDAYRFHHFEGGGCSCKDYW